MKTTIEINGRIYDARTGRIITADSAAPVQSSQSPAALQAPKLQQGKVMDGVSKIRPVDVSPLSPKAVKARPHPKYAASTPQKSKTLIRKAVKKPGANKEPSVPTVHSTSANMNSRVEQSATGRGLLLKRVPDVRLSRAKQAKKSMRIHKFSTAIAPTAKITDHLTVKKAPVHNPIAQPIQTNSVAASAPAIAPPVPTIHSKKASVFEDRLLTANSHLQKPLAKKKRSKRLSLPSFRISPKIMSFSAAAFALLLLGGFLAYQNVPAVSMRVAANEAGFSGKLPKSIPAGYSFDGPVEAEPANITLTYTSNSDTRKFVITQKPTNWSSEGLLTNYLVDSQLRYQAYKDKGLTVYIYNGSNATWVDKGVWFSVRGDDGSLSAEQLLDIAANI